MPDPFVHDGPIEPERPGAIEGTALGLDDPGRAVTFQEFRSLVDQVNASIQASHARRRRIARDRRVGWAILTILIVLVAWVAVVQFKSGEDLRRSLYESCVGAEASSREQARLYEQIVALSPRKDSPMVLLLNQAAVNLRADRHCEEKYQ
jgi:hypothetical protein